MNAHRPRRIACVWIPHFVAQAEGIALEGAADTPPVVIHEAGRVLDIYPLPAGDPLPPGMTLSQARALLPGAALRQANLGRYAALWESAVDALAAHTPLIEPAEEGVAYLEASGLEQLYGSLAGWCDALCRDVRQLAGLSLRIGVAENKWTAWIAAHQADAMAPHCIVAGAAREFLAPLSLECIPFSEEARRRLRALGLRTLGHFARLTPAAVAEQLGAEWLIWQQRAAGRDERPLLGRERRCLEAGWEFDVPAEGREALLEIGVGVGRRLLRRLERAGLVAGRAELSLVFAEGTSWQGQVTVREPLDTARLRLLLDELLSGVAIESAGVAELRLRLSGLGPARGRQLELFPSSEPRDETARVWQTIAPRHRPCSLWTIQAPHPEARLIAERYPLVEYRA